MSLHSVYTNIDLMKSLGSVKGLIKTKSLNAFKENLIKIKQMPSFTKKKSTSKIQNMSGSFMHFEKTKKALNYTQVPLDSQSNDLIKNNKSTKPNSQGFKTKKSLGSNTLRSIENKLGSETRDSLKRKSESM